MINLKKWKQVIALLLALAVLQISLLQAARVSATEVPNTFTEGTPARAADVNENFDAVELAIDDHWTRYPDRYYPNWRNEAGFYLSLPTLGNRWRGQLNSEYGFGQTSNRNLNFINAYDSGNRFNRIWLGISVVPSPDGSAAASSRLAAGFDESSTNLYSFSVSHHKDGSYSSLEITRDVSLDSIYGSSQTSYLSYLSSESVTGLLSDLYTALDLANETTVKYCGTLSFYMNADQEIAVSATDCVSITPS